MKTTKLKIKLTTLHLPFPSARPCLILTSTTTSTTTPLPPHQPNPSHRTPTNHPSTPLSSRRNFSLSSPLHFKEVNPFPLTTTPSTHVTKPAWPHPGYTEAEVHSIGVAHRDARTWSDYVALGTIRTLRWGMDAVTGYRHDETAASPLLTKGQKATARARGTTERGYLIRNIFLETIAGVPGMVAGMLRHLHSMRRLRRDNGWIESLLEESYNERMHLLTFLKMAEPGLFMRVMVLGAQGVFFNAFFLAYLISPATCHRFVGYLEEEAVITYTRQIADLEAGKLPKWEKLQAPDIAVNYWQMPEGKRSMLDLLYYIRADEAKHREVNHTLGNLDQKMDPNPFVAEFKDLSKPHPGKGIEHIKPTGWERSEVI